MDKTQDREEVEAKIWKAVDSTRFGMLGVVGGEPRHFKPMTAFTDRQAGRIWFFGTKSSELTEEVGGGHEAMFTFIAKDQSVSACFGGQLKVDTDRSKIDEYWNVHVAAWYPGGKSDPDLILFRFDLGDVEVWVSEKGPIRYGYELAKAKITGEEPDIGVHTHLNLQ